MTFAEHVALFLISALLGFLTAGVVYGITSSGDAAATWGVIVWLAAWLGIVFIDSEDLF